MGEMEIAACMQMDLTKSRNFPIQFREPQTSAEFLASKFTVVDSLPLLGLRLY